MKALAANAVVHCSKFATTMGKVCVCVGGGGGITCYMRLLLLGNFPPSVD